MFIGCVFWTGGSIGRIIWLTDGDCGSCACGGCGGCGIGICACEDCGSCEFGSYGICELGSCRFWGCTLKFCGLRGCISVVFDEFDIFLDPLEAPNLAEGILLFISTVVVKI